MGYTTKFDGKFRLDRKLDAKTELFLVRLANTRRMKRDVSKLPSTGFEKYGFGDWGVEGEYYVDYDGFQDASVIDCVFWPSTQPGLWCQWVPTEDGLHIEWDGVEKFYEYIPWLEYIIDKVLVPRGYILNGRVHWQGEDFKDYGDIVVRDNVVTYC